MVRFAETDELLPLKARENEENSSDSEVEETSRRADEANKLLTPGLNATTRSQGYSRQESMRTTSFFFHVSSFGVVLFLLLHSFQTNLTLCVFLFLLCFVCSYTEYHAAALKRDILQSFRDFRAFRKHEPSVRSKQRARLNVIFASSLAVTITVLVAIAGWTAYKRIYEPIHNHHVLEEEIRQHAQAARERAARCQGFDWQRACDSMGAAGARRRSLYTGQGDRDIELEDELILSDDPTITYDQNCLRVYRLQLQNNITFPYHSSQLLHRGGVRWIK
jgi:hypothetical protein